MTQIAQEFRDIAILVVDDQPIARDLVRTILKGNGFNTILVAENGRTALDILMQARVELMICDWNMPNLTGVELLRKVRAIPQYKELPFLMLTAEAYRENVQEAMAAGVTDYVTKPFTAEVLTQKINTILSKKKK